MNGKSATRGIFMSAYSERYAAIDVGTNSCRLLIADVGEGRLVPVLFTLRMTRIGEGASEKGYLQQEPVRRTVVALQGFLSLARSYGVSRIRAVATSAVREAANAAFFLERARDEAGLIVDVISGEEEARLNYVGVCRSLSLGRRAAVIDIGGGSTEFTYPLAEGGGNALFCRSVPLGAVRLTEHPLLLSEILGSLKSALDDLREFRQDMVGVGGTVTTLAAVDQDLEEYDPGRIQGYYLTRAAVERIMFSLAAKNTEERKRVPGLQPERADIIVAGTTILWAILTYLGAPGITVSEADLLHGIILEMISL